jgi:D-alanyl-D-alanine carboxypeptidase
MDCGKTPLKPAAVLGSLLFVSAALAAAPPRGALDALVRETMQRERIAGISLAVARSGRLEFAGAYGYAKLTPRIQATPQTIYPVGSLTKQFTAAAMVREMQTHRIDENAPLAAYLPEYASTPAVTIGMLLQQTSGIASYEEIVPQTADGNPRALARAVMDAPLRFTPGTRFEYSNSNALMLGLLLESLEHRAYADIVYSWFTGPLELRATRYIAQAVLTTQGYDESGKAVTADPPGYLFASAGMTSNVIDAVRWEDALYAGTVLGENDTNRFFMPPMLPNGAPTGYSMGAAVRTIDGYAVFYQSGNVSGYSAIVLHQTHAHLTLALFTNRDRLDLLPLTKSIIRLFDPSPERAV